MKKLYKILGIFAMVAISFMIFAVWYSPVAKAESLGNLQKPILEVLGKPLVEMRIVAINNVGMEPKKLVVIKWVYEQGVITFRRLGGEWSITDVEINDPPTGLQSLLKGV